jgi:F0F1-type ATP synthase assembly protein I
MAVIIGAGCFGGYKLDARYNNTTPVFTIILSLLSIAIAIYIVLKDLSNPNLNGR